MKHHHHYHHHSQNTTKNIQIAFFLNLAFTLLEIVGGLLTNSLAIFTDALHDLGDSLSLGLAWYFQRLSQKGSDKYFTYGYKRFSLLGAFINASIIIIGSIFILQEAIPRLIQPEEVNPQGMLFLAIIGILINGIAAFKLFKGKSINERVVALHLLEDVLGWFVILIGSIIIMFTNLTIIDPILSILISLYILFNAFRHLKKIFKVFLQAVPSEISLQDIHQITQTIPEIINSHDLHIWTLDEETHILSFHAVVKDDMTSLEVQNIKRTIRQKLKSLRIWHVTIEIEGESETCEYE